MVAGRVLVSFLLFPALFSSRFKGRVLCCGLMRRRAQSAARPVPGRARRKSQNHSREPLRMLRVRPSDVQSVVLIVFGTICAFTPSPPWGGVHR